MSHPDSPSDQPNLGASQLHLEVAFAPREDVEDPRIVDKLRYTPEVRILHDSLRASAFRFTGDRAPSCVAVEP